MNAASLLESQHPLGAVSSALVAPLPSGDADLLKQTMHGMAWRASLCAAKLTSFSGPVRHQSLL